MTMSDQRPVVWCRDSVPAVALMVAPLTPVASGPYVFPPWRSRWVQELMGGWIGGRQPRRLFGVQAYQGQSRSCQESKPAIAKLLLCNITLYDRIAHAMRLA
jgi:hypothetical protein